VHNVAAFVARLFAGAEEETNARGNRVRRAFARTERYVIDAAEDFAAEGWEQFDTDQDAPYFGFWVNARRRETLTYAEGDWIHVACPTAASYNAEIADAIAFYAEGWTVKTLDRGGLTTYVQDRSRFLLAAGLGT